MTRDGVPCLRRVAKLYLPPGVPYFGCRTCHNLTYESAQTHDKRVDRLRRDPELLGAVLENPRAASDTMLILAMKALR
ncbi:MAG: hypothetical protein L0Z62_26765 [Gemmataceae bacterium]|nr:hypothetical protein [Gemmataceae bacterium]